MLQRKRLFLQAPALLRQFHGSFRTQTSLVPSFEEHFTDCLKENKYEDLYKFLAKDYTELNKISLFSDAIGHLVRRNDYSNAFIAVEKYYHLLNQLVLRHESSSIRNHLSGNDQQKIFCTMEASNPFELEILHLLQTGRPYEAECSVEKHAHDLNKLKLYTWIIAHHVNEQSFFSAYATLTSYFHAMCALVSAQSTQQHDLKREEKLNVIEGEKKEKEATIRHPVQKDQQNQHHRSTIETAIMGEEFQKYMDECFQDIVGLGQVRKQVKRFMYATMLNKLRVQRNLSRDEHLVHNLHSVLIGNPGTGKSSVARIIGKLLCHIGVIKKPKFREVYRENLVGEFIGQTEAQMAKLFGEARGGIIFVDEAYRLTSPSDRDMTRDFGIIALEAMLGEMTRQRPPEDQIVFMFAGYPEPMRKFIQSNPGFRRRIGHVFNLPDYNCFEISEIFKRKFEQAHFVVGNQLVDELPYIFLEHFPRDMVAQLNGGLAERVFDLARDELNERIVSQQTQAMPGYNRSQGIITDEMLMTIERCDVVSAVKNLKRSVKSM